MFAAAAIGALLTVAEPEGEVPPPVPDVAAITHRLDEAIDRLERMLVLPGPVAQ